MEKIIQKTLEQHHVKKEKKSTAYKLRNRQTKILNETKFTRSLRNLLRHYQL